MCLWRCLLVIVWGRFICVIQIWWDIGLWTVAGRSLWWLITIHLAAAVNIDSSRDFQFEPRDISWNITECVEERKEIGRERDRSGPRGPWITISPTTPCSFLILIYLFKSNDPLLLSVWSYWVEHELIFSALNYWVLLFIFFLSDPVIPVLVFSALSLYLLTVDSGPQAMHLKDNMSIFLL